MVGGMRLTGAMTRPTEDMFDAQDLCCFMGQEILNPPSVEGWHTGSEWINSGALVDRVNYGARLLSDLTMPGVMAMIDRLSNQDGGTYTPRELVDGCLDMMGPITMADESSYSSLVDHVARRGDLSFNDHERGGESEKRVAELMSLIASTREYQLA